MNFYNANPSWVDIVSALSSAVVAIAAVLAAIFAARGLSAWRSELVGRRKYELAEQVLLVLSEFTEIMSYIRHPASSGSEHAQIEQQEGESAEDFQIRRTYSIAVLRYHKHGDYFANLRALKFKARVILGKEFERPLERALGLVSEVLSAAHTAHLFARQFDLQARRSESRGMRPGDVDWATKLHEKEDIYWGVGGDNDKISVRVKEIVTEAEEIYRVVLAS